MDLELFDRILCSLRDEGYAIGEIEYCGQGEPLLHPNFPEFVARARKYFPATHQRLITSGNFCFASTVRDAALNEIMVSCDGAFPESYARYRIGGALERVLHFLRDARAAASFPEIVLVWKYILFEWNDSTEELKEAQRISEEFRVDWLLFVYTHSVGKSRRHSVEDPSSLPVRGARIVTNATPIHYRSSPS
jgi:MoaA/NifB/PqqE/SkfB family radical SAM enzyme